MANLFILNVADITAPVAADKNARRLIDVAAERLNMAAAVSGTDAWAALSTSEADPYDAEAARVALFSSVAAGEVAVEDVAAALKSIATKEAAAEAAASQAPSVLLLAGEPASAAEVKRAFRGAESGMTVEVASLDGSTTGTITMFRV